MTDPEPTSEDELRAFVARKIGDLQADFAKLIATLSLLTPVQAGNLAGRNRRLLHIAIGLLILLIALLAIHVAWSAGWLRS